MAELSTLARPYAKAAFAFAQERHALPAWSTMLETAAAVAEEPRVAQKINAPSLGAADRAALLIELCGDALDQAGHNFLHILAKNFRLPLLREVARLFEELKAAAEKEAAVEIISAMPLEQETTARLTQALGTRLGQELNVRVRVDENLLGGAVVRTGDVVINGSVQGRLQRLAEAIKG